MARFLTTFAAAAVVALVCTSPTCGAARKHGPTTEAAFEPQTVKWMSKQRDLLQVFGLIQGGQVAPKGRFPYVTLFVDRREDQACGGILIHESWVATAAHCLDTAARVDGNPLGLNPLMILGAHNIADREDVQGVEVVIGDALLHPLWDGNLQNGYDLALVRLPQPSSIQPIKLPAVGSEYANGEALVALGWGQQGQGLAPPDLLKWGQLSYRDNKLCNRQDVWNQNVKSSMMCAGARLGDADVCKGDSGGPLILPNVPNGKVENGDPGADILAGLVSFGDVPGCNTDTPIDLRKPGVFTRISTARNWIEDVISGKFKEEEQRSTPSVERRNIAEDKDNEVGQKELEELHKEMSVAIYNEDIEEIQDLLSQGADINFQGEYEQTPLMKAVTAESFVVVQYLLSQGAKVDVQSVYENTALIFAARAGLIEIVKILLDAGADVDLESKFGTTALIEAAYNGHLEAVKILLAAGANKDAKDKSGTAKDQICLGQEANCSDEVIRQLTALL